MKPRRKRNPNQFDRDSLTLHDTGVDQFLQLCRNTRTPFARKVESLLEAKDFMSIVSLAVDPSEYTDSDLFRQDYLLAEVMSKYPHWDLGIDTRAVAIQKFRASEMSCGFINRILSHFLASPNIGEAPAVVFMARRKIQNLLGDFDWDEAAQHFAWGPGASTSKSRRHADTYYKFGDHTDASATLSPLVPALLRWLRPWNPTVRYVPGGKGTTVPKNAKTDRFIMIEPDLNLFTQMGIGGLIRSRLRRVGLLKPDSQMDNQSLARLASLSGEMATIDLTAASDSISLRLVEELLPDDWVSAIHLCRSPYCVLPSGESVRLEKVSSMGNGFTFELETLIFWALCSAYCALHGFNTHRNLVYGDDIIMPSQLADGFATVLADLGFSLNRKKSFWSGPFRESCGKHYFSGNDVTPFYIREKVNSVDRYYWLANTYRLWGGFAMDPSSIEALRQGLVDELPPKFRNVAIPLTAGSDTGLFEDLDVAMSCSSVERSRNYQRGWLYPCLTRDAKHLDRQGHRRLLKSLWIIGRGKGVESHEYDIAWKLLPLQHPARKAIARMRTSQPVFSVIKPQNRWTLRRESKRSWTPQWLDLNSYGNEDPVG